MASIWKQNREVTNDVKRNNFDLSKQAHDTFKFGYLYPVYCQRVYPTDSFRIRTAFDLKMMPLMFPLQSRVRAHMHYFYVRNKNLWSGWEDFISGLKSPVSHPHPYVQLNDADVKTGGIHDFLGVPTTVITKSSYSANLFPFGYQLESSTMEDPYPVVAGHTELITPLPCGSSWNVDSKLVDVVGVGSNYCYILGSMYHKPSENKFYIPNQTGNFRLYYCVVQNRVASPDDLLDAVIKGYFVLSSDGDGYYHLSSSDFNSLITFYDSLSTGDYLVPCLFRTTSIASYDKNVDGLNVGMRYTTASSSGFVQYDTTNLNYYHDHQPLNALPYRAYQSIYYGYYANDILQPLVINGEKEYNKFVENDGDGLDTTNYHLYRRNYELDFLTSCMPSPQAGPAPLVGISALGEVTITDANGVSTGNAEIASDGTITKIVATSPLASVEHGRTMMNIAALGFNINDLRSANALQRLAEQTLRSGYRYINWVKGQYGRSPEYRELDMPEFIGGFSRDIQIGTVVSQADTAVGGNGQYLGAYGANGRVIGGSRHDITHYCDDYGWIIGVMCITPTPAYSQLLPKQMLAPTNPLDYANPFMNQIGMQPVTYREVCPLQAYEESLYDPSKSVDDTFGYQRPNYDEVGAVDEVHGDFRGSLKDYLINRQFDGRPELGTEFLEVNPSEINDIFVDQNPDDDVFIGNLAFNVSAKRPFPRVHMPGLGR